VRPGLALRQPQDADDVAALITLCHFFQEFIRLNFGNPKFGDDCIDTSGTDWLPFGDFLPDAAQDFGIIGAVIGGDAGAVHFLRQGVDVICCDSHACLLFEKS
jgi:hypothetical protein